MSIILLILLSLSLMDRCCRARRVDNICSTRGSKSVFIGLGESGVLTAFNVTRGDSANVSLHEGCQVDVVTCPSCIISLTFRLLDLSCHCGARRFNLFLHNPCRCDHVWISEPPYGDASGVSFYTVGQVSGAREKGLGYKSKTRTVRIWLFYRVAHAHAFTLDYKSEPNRQFFFGTSQHPLRLNFSAGFISSPFFPVAYPPDVVAEYVLTCVKHANFSSLPVDHPPDDDGDCRVRLTFTDFQLASSSVVEFYEGSRRLGVASGISFRPPFIVSTTNSLMIRFYASGQSDVGFKAVFSFCSESILKKIVKPSTDCGGYVDNFGGTITMMNMVESEKKSFDCIWLIKPLKNFSSVKSHLYLKVTTFLGFAGDAELQIRKGLTSESPTLEKLRNPVSQNFQEHVISLQSGFYVSLRAAFGPASHFAVSYASFSHKKCVVLPGFLCRNFRCISKKLRCDGFDHCGDGSDEPAFCGRGRGSERGVSGGRREESNYYFPKINEYSVVKTASTVFLASLAGLVFLVSSLTLALCRIEAKAPRQTNLRDELQSVSNFRDCLSDEVSVEDVVIEDPPSYEPPPNYEEVVQISMDNTDFPQNSLEFKILRIN